MNEIQLCKYTDENIVYCLNYYYSSFGVNKYANICFCRPSRCSIKRRDAVHVYKQKLQSFFSPPLVFVNYLPKNNEDRCCQGFIKKENTIPLMNQKPFWIFFLTALSLSKNWYPRISIVYALIRIIFCDNTTFI